MRIGGQGKDSPIARFVADKLQSMNFVHQFGAGTNPIQNGPEGVAVAKEHGELGILQTFDPSGININVLTGGGVPSGGARSAEPNSVGIQVNSIRPLLGEVGGVRGI